MNKRKDIHEINKEYSGKFWAKRLSMKFFLYTEKIHYYYLIKFLKGLGGYYKNRKLVDIGIGDGKYLISITKKYKFDSVGLDISPEVISLYNKKISNMNIHSKGFLLKPSTKKLPFKSKSVDLIICSHVLEHVPNDKILLKEIFRMLNPGGMVYFNVPINEEKLKIPNHIRKYSSRKFTGLLKKSGFKILQNFESDYYSLIISSLGIKKNIFSTVIKRFLIIILSFLPISISNSGLNLLKLKNSQFTVFASR